MRAYRLSVNLKLALIVGAVLIAVASLAYTNHLANRLREREEAVVRLWARAIEHQFQVPTGNPYRSELAQLERLVERWQIGGGGAGAFGEFDAETLDSLDRALEWAQSMPPSEELNFVTNEIIVPNLFSVPAILTDSTGEEVRTVRNVEIDSAWSEARRDRYLRQRVVAMDQAHDPITVELDGGLTQKVHYGESELVRHLRIFPYVQLVFVALFVLVGYMGFSYVRKSEQSNLWVGMAKEAAHQLGTPLSSMMGWLAVLQDEELSSPEAARAVDELEKDVGRLKRVTNRFSTIGSQPKLSESAVRPLVEGVADYIRQRIPDEGQRIHLQVDIPEGLTAPLNPDLFEWVIENLLKNALDAIEAEEGRVEIRGRESGDQVELEIEDSGCGIDKREWKNIFRPGYSTKKRGWGLGLSLAKRVIEEYHGGRLAVVSSTPGEGTTFRITLERG